MRVTTEILTHATHVNGWEPAVYISCMSLKFRFLFVSNLYVRNFRYIFAHVSVVAVTARVSTAE